MLLVLRRARGPRRGVVTHVVHAASGAQSLHLGLVSRQCRLAESKTREETGRVGSEIPRQVTHRAVAANAVRRLNLCVVEIAFSTGHSVVMRGCRDLEFRRINEQSV